MNHGQYIQASDRIIRLITEVNRPNFRTTLDVGNFWCVDEDPLTAVQKIIPYASMVHLKDFYYRRAYLDPGEGWFQTASGNHLRGSILGQGDLDLRHILRCIQHAGYEGNVSIEFEGMEDCKLGSRIGMDNAKRLLAEIH